MPKPWTFGAESLAVIDTIHPDLRKIAQLLRVRSPKDFMVREGRRSREEQERAYAMGLTKLHYPNSAHNVEPPGLSRAVHFIPYPINWNQRPPLDCYLLAGVVLQLADELGIPLVWGGYWKDPHDPNHFELLRLPPL